MGQRINVTNPTAMPIYVGSAMIPPGETRQFDENEVPLHLRPQKAPAPPPQPAKGPDPLEALAAKPARDVIAAVPGLKDEDLGRLKKLEEARMHEDRPAPRKTVLEAIAAEVLTRAGGSQG